MNRQKLTTTWALFGGAALLSASTLYGAASITDNFSVAHDYSAGDVSGTIWDGFLANGGGAQNTTIQAVDANTTVPNALVINTTNGNWENGDNDGAFLYRNVTGDFTVKVSLDAPYVAYNTAGIMARNADNSGGENWVSVQLFGAFNSSRAIRNTTNGGSVTTYPTYPTASGAARDDGTNNTQTAGDLTLIRAGDLFTATLLTTNDTNDGMETISYSVTRSDLPDTLQVGLSQANFADLNATSTFSNFSLVPEPSSLMLAGLAALGLLGFRRRH